MTQFCFLDYNNNGKPIHTQEIHPRFLEWFIGFFEGDGYITQWSDKGQLRCAIGIDQKDPALLYKIRTTLGFGRIRQYTRNQETYWRWIVESEKNIERLIRLLNGNLILKHRRIQFRYLFESFQKKYMKTGLAYKECNIQPTLSDAWLSGFCEAECGFDGNFTRNFKRGRYKDGSQRYAIKLRFYLTQKLMDDNILYSIANLFELKKIRIYPVQNSNKTGSFLYYRLEINTKRGHDLLIDYLQKFPLKGIKRIDFLRFMLLRRRQLLRGSRIESEHMAKRTARLINFFVKKRKFHLSQDFTYLLSNSKQFEKQSD